ncbi:MAG TPA: helix-turn-helix domain-containing protein [Armatimonadota bacterium]|nr:helix-turn-helix domain-containing protein [Armatimonadota bacterium]
MGYRSPGEWARLRETGLMRLAEGASPKEVASELGVVVRTVRKWRRAAERAPLELVASGGRLPGRQERKRVVSVWRWAIAQALLPKALKGDVRAAGLLVKLMEREGKSEQGTADRGAEEEALGSVRLPWQEDDIQSDEGEGGV